MRIDSDGNLSVNGNLTVNTNTLKVDATNNRVGIGTTSPFHALDVTGNIAASGLHQLMIYPLGI